MGAIDSDPEVDADGDATDLFLDDEPPEPLSNPPPSHRLLTNQYDSLKALKSDLQDFTASAGFCVLKLRSNNYVNSIGYTNVTFSYQRGAIRPSKAVSRSTSTIKMGCPWKTTAKALVKNGRKWTLKINANYNSHKNHSGDGFNSRPHLSTEHKTFIATFTDRVGISNREVATSLRDTFPGVLFTMRQIRNYQYKLRKQVIARYTPF